MQLAEVAGHATATIKHPSFARWRLVVVQPLDAMRRPEGDPLLALDSLGVGAGDTVVLSSDGSGARQLVAAPSSPARWFVMGLVDENL
jgi:ethanolamine utilization protein EutN